MVDWLATLLIVGPTTVDSLEGFLSTATGSLSSCNIPRHRLHRLQLLPDVRRNHFSRGASAFQVDVLVNVSTIDVFIISTC